jgi:signal transduction histidine kinase
MPVDIILTSSRKRQLAWNFFSKQLEEYSLVVDGLPARKKQIFDLLYAEGESDSQLLLVQDRKTDIFIIESHITGNTYSLKQYNITYKERSDCKDYNPKQAEENNVKSILKGYVTRQVKPIRGVIDLNRLAELFNDFAFVVYQNHEKIEREADKLYKLI